MTWNISLRALRTFWTSALVLCSLPMYGQTANTGAIAGTVSDPSGALVARAAIVVKSQATQEERHLATDAEGNFSVPFLTPGNYDLTVRAPGFEPIVLKGCSGSNYRGEPAQDSASNRRRKGTDRG